ncbi:MAG: fibrobacter succinogenes major paralogous domain-containing protein [Fibromonadaceae bacterium]|jgi:uncharacterized protein (TIGR02145 family)|nr:fibrobacter succinogenes major paralogous domain-containing protein [Fibromonadaceae bacterium]
MKETLSKLIFTVGLSLALAFTFSACSNESGVGPNINEPDICEMYPTDGACSVKCDGETYNPTSQFCSNIDNKIYDKCGGLLGLEYNPETHFCIGSKVQLKCGDETYLEGQFCFDNKIWDICDGETYNPRDYSCIENELWHKCGGRTYDPNTQVCGGNEILNKCGSNKAYNPETHLCINGEIWNNCDGEAYNFDNQFCSNIDDQIYDRCGGLGGLEYNPETHFCIGSKVQLKCGGETYNPETHFCSNIDDQIYDRCGGKEYDLTTQRCSNDILQEKCGTDWYDPSTEYCSNGTRKTYGSVEHGGQIYKTIEIGTQIWMAENLNYMYATGSVCYNNNCNYGRLYNWATAMDLPSKCNNTRSFLDSDCRINTPHRGVCPEGFHVPTDSEWITLRDFVGSDPGTKLKLTTGWYDNGNGTNDYGFSAWPGGVRDVNGNFSPAGYYGYWWSASESNATTAYGRYMSYDNSLVNQSNGSKLTDISVRCVKD